jgi:hypothetical protein
VHRRARRRAPTTGNAKTQPGQTPGASDLCTDAPEGAPPRRGTQKRTRHRRMTTVVVENKKLPSPPPPPPRPPPWGQAAGRGTTFGAGCVARRDASAPLPPHLQSTRALSAIDPCCCMRARARHPSLERCCACTDGPGMESELISSAARALRGARRKERVGRWQMERMLGTDLSPARAACVGGSLRGHELARLGSQSASPPWRARFKARGERGAQIDGKWRD